MSKSRIVNTGHILNRVYTQSTVGRSNVDVREMLVPFTPPPVPDYRPLPPVIYICTYYRPLPPIIYSGFYTKIELFSKLLFKLDVYIVLRLTTDNNFM